jgi:hypothetical protein
MSQPDKNHCIKCGGALNGSYIGKFQFIHPVGFFGGTLVSEWLLCWRCARDLEHYIDTQWLNSQHHPAVTA